MFGDRQHGRLAPKPTAHSKTPRLRPNPSWVQKQAENAQARTSITPLPVPQTLSPASNLRLVGINQQYHGLSLRLATREFTSTVWLTCMSTGCIANAFALL